jgi:putative ABC transport system permease protein
LVSTVSDIRRAFRLLGRTPAVTLIAILSIAIGAGAAAVVFAAVKAVLIEPFPYSHPETLVQIRTDTGRGGSPQQDWVSWNDMEDVARENHSFTAIGTYHYALFNLGGDRGSLPEALYGLYVSASVFPTLGANPMLGRNILPEEAQPGRDREMILSYGLWVRRFHADPGAVGRVVEVNGHGCRIIGVMPAGFDFPMRLATTVSTPSRHMDFWAPEAVDPARTSRGTTGYGAIARLRPGTSLDEAQQDLSAIAARLASAYPRTNQNRTLQAGWLRDRTLGFAQTGLLLLMAAALIFLLIGCANVANLLLARMLARHREMAIRAALGAGRMRIVRQLVTESSVLAALGGLAAYALTALAWRLLPAVTPMSIPRLAAARADGTVLAFALLVSVLTGIAAGSTPAWRAAALQPADALRESGVRGTAGRSHNRFRSLLLLCEIAVTVVLVVIGGALTGSFVRLLRTDPGFEADHVLASIIVASGDRYLNHPEAQALLFRRILDSVRALSGVESAGTVHPLPFSGDNNGGWVTATDAGVARPETQSVAEVDTVSAGYLETMGVPLLQGRWFREEEMDPAREVAIVNDLAAARLWPGEDTIGKRICINCTPDRPAHWKQVIGVAGSIRHAALDQPPGMQVYLSGGALATADFLVVRSHRPFAGLGREIRRAVAAIDPNQPVFLSAGMSTLIGDSLSDRRFIVTLLAITGCLALLLSAAGVYGVVSYVTSRRTQEIGVRMTLGATPRQVRALVFRQSMRLAVLGIVIGLLTAVAVASVLRHWLAGFGTDDPALMGMAVALVAATAAVACWIPAWRATRVDPMVALRQE